MGESRTVTVGLDVHARSIRLAAVRADELLEERTLPYDEEAVERVLRRWPGVRCCYEAGPTGFGLYRHLVERGIDCRWWRRGWCRSGRAIGSRPIQRDARKLARLLAGGLLEPIHVPSPELEAARDLVRAREDARLDRMRDRHRLSKFCLRHGRRLPTSSWGVDSPQVAVRAALRASPPSSRPSTPTCTRVDLVDAPDRGARARDRARRPSRSRGASSSPGCAACAASTP